MIIECYGIVQDPLTKECMIIMSYANGGDLHKYLQKNFINITWKTKLCILWSISLGYLYFQCINLHLYFKVY